jgi:anti-sigma factor RsiW
LSAPFTVVRSYVTHVEEERTGFLGGAAFGHARGITLVTMSCNHVRQQLWPDPHAAASAPEAMAALAHYRGCVACQRFFALDGDIGRRLLSLRECARAPATLHRRIERAIAAERSVRRRPRVRWLGPAGLVAAAAVAVAVIGLPRSSPWLAQPVAQEARLGLTAASGSFTNTDAGVLASWLQERMGYSVDIPDIAGARVVGARVATIGEGQGAVVVYEYSGTRLTYIALPTIDGRGTQLRAGMVTSAAADGYEIALWTENGALRAVAAPLSRSTLIGVAEECRRKATTAS